MLQRNSHDGFICVTCGYVADESDESAHNRADMFLHLHEDCEGEVANAL